MGYYDEDRLTPEQVAIYRRMTPEQKMKIVWDLRRHAWDLKAACLRAQHPDWTEEQVQDAVRRMFIVAVT